MNTLVAAIVFRGDRRVDSVRRAREPEREVVPERDVAIEGEKE